MAQSKKREALKLFHGLLADGDQRDYPTYIKEVGDYLTNKIKLEELIAKLEEFSKADVTEGPINNG